VEAYKTYYKYQNSKIKTGARKSLAAPDYSILLAI